MHRTNQGSHRNSFMEKTSLYPGTVVMYPRAVACVFVHVQYRYMCTCDRRYSVIRRGSRGWALGRAPTPGNGVSPLKIRYSIAFKHQSVTGRPPLGEILYPPLVIFLLFVSVCSVLFSNVNYRRLLMIHYVIQIYCLFIGALGRVDGKGHFAPIWTQLC